VPRLPSAVLRSFPLKTPEKVFTVFWAKPPPPEIVSRGELLKVGAFSKFPSFRNHFHHKAKPTSTRLFMPMLKTFFFILHFYTFAIICVPRGAHYDRRVNSHSVVFVVLWGLTLTLPLWRTWRVGVGRRSRLHALLMSNTGDGGGCDLCRLQCLVVQGIFSANGRRAGRGYKVTDRLPPPPPRGMFTTLFLF